MKKISIIAMLTIIYPELVLGYLPTITDDSVRNHSYSTEQITHDVYNAAKQQNASAPVFSVDGKYYKWAVPDLTTYKTSSGVDVFSQKNQNKGSVDFVAMDADNNVVTKTYYYNKLDAAGNTITNQEGDDIESVTGDFIYVGRSIHNGGWYNNNEQDFSIIESVSGNFIGNVTTSKYANVEGAIYNTELGKINSISGNFIGNSAGSPQSNWYEDGVTKNNASGGIISNYYGNIGTISGNFIGNSASGSNSSFGGAIYSRNGNIDSIYGVFIGNVANDAYGNGGAISAEESSHIKTINADFIGNSAYNGGAIMASNSSTITEIVGDFVGNSGEYGGAIYNDATINSVSGNFIGNSACYGGAINNYGTMTLTNNVVLSGNRADYGGGIYNSGTLNMNIDSNSAIRFETSTDIIENGYGNIRATGTGDLPGHLYLQRVSGDGYNYENGAIFVLKNIYAEVASNQDFRQNKLYIDSSSTLTLNGGDLYIAKDFVNDGLLKFNGGSLYAQNMSGGGEVVVCGDVAFDGRVPMRITISEGGELTTSLNTIDGGSITNGGNIWLHDDKLTKKLSDLSLSGFVGIKNLEARADLLDMDIANVGTLHITGGTLSNRIYGGLGTVNIMDDTTINAPVDQDALQISINSSLTTDADNLIVSSLYNSGTFVLTGGTLNTDIDAYKNHTLLNGTLVIDGDVVSKAKIYQTTKINQGKTLTTSADNLTMDSLQNLGKLVLTDGVFIADIANESGTVIVNGDVNAAGRISHGVLTIQKDSLLTTDANWLQMDKLQNLGDLVLTGGTLLTNLNGADYCGGNIFVDGSVSSDAIIAQPFTIKPNSQLMMNADNLQTDKLQNLGDLVLTGGTLTNGIINDAGTVQIANTVAIDTLFSSGNLDVNYGGNLLINADNLKVDTLDNFGALVLTGGTLTTDVKYPDGGSWGTGQVVIDGDVVSDAKITQEITINQGKTLTTSADNITETTIVNNGNLKLTSGTFNSGIYGAGEIVIAGDVDAYWYDYDQDINISEGGKFTVQGFGASYAYNINNSGILNVTGIGCLEQDVTGGTVIIGPDAFINASRVHDIEMNGNWNIGSKTVYAADATINGIVNIDVNNASQHSEDYSGGKLIADSITLGDNSELRLVMNNIQLAVGESTGYLKLIDSESWDGKWGNLLKNNNMFDITFDESLHAFKIKRTRDYADISQTIGGGDASQNIYVVILVWGDVNESTDPFIQGILNKLNYAAQYDNDGFVRLLTNIAPNNSNVISGTSQSVHNAINSQVSDRLAAIGRSGGDAFHGLSLWAQGLYNHSQQSGDTEFTGNTFGFTLGADKKLTENTVLGLGYSLSSTTAQSGDRNIDALGHTVFVYGEYRPFNVKRDDNGKLISKIISPLYLNATVSYGLADYDETAAHGITSEYDVSTLGLEANLGYNITKNWDLFVGARHLRISQSNYTDKMGQDISVQDDEIVTARLGAKYVHNGRLFAPSAHLSFGYDLESAEKMALVSAEKSTYQIFTEPLNPFSVQTGIGLTSDVHNWNLSLNYDLEWRPDFISHTGRFKAKYVF